MRHGNGLQRPEGKERVERGRQQNLKSIIPPVSCYKIALVVDDGAGSALPAIISHRPVHHPRRGAAAVVVVEMWGRRQRGMD